MLFIDTASRGSSRIFSLSDEEIEYDLFEEFDVGVSTFFHDDNVNKLVEAGLIDKDALPICRGIRKRWIELESRKWKVGEIKCDPQWKRLFSACDQLLKLTRRNDREVT